MKKIIGIIKMLNYTKLLAILIVTMLSFCIFSSIYTVKEGETAILKTLGKVSYISEPGIYLKFPYPIQEINVVSVSKINTIKIGFIENFGNKKREKNIKENLMITGDENIIHVNLSIDWKIKDSCDFLFNAKEPESILKSAAISSLTSVIGNASLDSILTDGKTKIENEAKEVLENIIQKYKIGIEIISVKIHDAQPPNQVLPAFQLVSDAKNQKNILVSKAEEYKNEKLLAAEGEEEKIIKEAEAYYEERISRANTDVAKFDSLYKEYKANKNVTKTRMLIEVLEEVLPNANIYIINDKDGTIKYLPVKEFGGEN